MKIGAAITFRSFDKSYSKLIPQIREAFVVRRNLFLIDQTHPLLEDHPLKGKWIGYRSINITGDVRAVYRTEGAVAIFFDIGTHDYLFDR